MKQLKLNQRGMAELIGVSQSTIGRILALKDRPSIKLANKIQLKLGKCGFYLDPTAEWPDAFKGVKPGIQTEETRDIDAAVLAAAGVFYSQIEGPSVDCGYAVAAALETLPVRLKTVLERRWGLTGREETNAEIAKEFNLSTSAVSAMERRALHKLRNSPSAMQAIRDNLP